MVLITITRMKDVLESKQIERIRRITGGETNYVGVYSKGSMDGRERGI